jgi:hypothetical protein
MLKGIQDKLRRENLHDPDSVQPVEGRLPKQPDARALSARTFDGTFNDLESPGMGSIGCRFGRNVPLKATFPKSRSC